MTTLREKQREKRGREILDAATELISARGYEETSMENIAGQAEVGVATLYNYFGSKLELLHALFDRYIDEQLEEGRVVIENPPADVVEGMAALFSAYADGMARRMPKKLLRELTAVAFSRQFSYGKDTLSKKMRLRDQCRDLMEHYHARGQVRQDATPDEAAMLCYSAISIPSTLFALDFGVTLDAAKEGMRRNLELVLTGLAPQGGTR
ncbi:MAG: TetR/AcrR family transcriptional regulator [Dehalococcoidia bacterium]|nr:TetR/AcrR family transcriptional regulator [Dehalococcoidia bacterium]